MTLIEGSERGTFMVDAQKVQCDYCQGTEFQISTLMDDPNDIEPKHLTEDFPPTFGDLLLTIGGGSFQGLVGMCSGCGHLKILLWYCIDVGTTDANVTTMTNLDQATTADLMKGLYGIPMTGTDAGDYFVIDSNTAVEGTVITWEVNPSGDEDAIWMITNTLPFGLTLHV